MRGVCSARGAVATVVVLLVAVPLCQSYSIVDIFANPSCSTSSAPFARYLGELACSSECVLDEHNASRSHHASVCSAPAPVAGFCIDDIAMSAVVYFTDDTCTQVAIGDGTSVGFLGECSPDLNPAVGVHAM